MNSPYNIIVSAKDNGATAGLRRVSAALGNVAARTRGIMLPPMRSMMRPFLALGASILSVHGIMRNLQGGFQALIASEKSLGGKSPLEEKLKKVSKQWKEIQAAFAQPLAQDFLNTSNEKGKELAGVLKAAASSFGRGLADAVQVFIAAFQRGTLVTAITEMIAIGLLKSAGMWLVKMLEGAYTIVATMGTGLTAVATTAFRKAANLLPGVDIGNGGYGDWKGGMVHDQQKMMEALGLGKNGEMTGATALSEGFDKWVNSRWDAMLKRNGVETTRPPADGTAPVGTPTTPESTSGGAGKPGTRLSDSYARTGLFVGGSYAGLNISANYAKRTAENSDKQTRLLTSIDQKLSTSGAATVWN